MTAQRRRRSSLLLLSLVSCSASAVVAGESTAHNVHAADESRPTAGNKYRIHVSESGRAINNEDRKSLRGLKHAHATDDVESNENTNADQSQKRISDMIDLAAPLYDEAVIPSPLEDQQDMERKLKKDDDKDDKKEKKDKDDNDKKEVTVIPPKSHSIIGTGNSVYHVSAGVIDLTNAPIKIPPSTPAQCFETKPYMGCDRGGADNQRLVFFGHDFGMGCAQADPCLFALMPIRMAYYCPKHGRPLCGGKCYNVAQHCPDNGILVDRNGTGHNVTDTKWGEANADSWNFWPANFGCPSCVS